MRLENAMFFTKLVLRAFPPAVRSVKGVCVLQFVWRHFCLRETELSELMVQGTRATSRYCTQISRFYKPHLFEKAEDIFVFLPDNLITILKQGNIHKPMGMRTKMKSSSWIVTFWGNFYTYIFLIAFFSIIFMEICHCC